MKSRQQALKLFLDTMVIVIVQIGNPFSPKVFHRIKFLQIKKFALEQTEEIFYDGIIQTVAFPAHILLDALLTKHPLVLLMMVLPALIGGEG